MPQHETAGAVHVRIHDDADVAAARAGARSLASREGLPETAVEALATAVSEVARNIVVHAGDGEVVLARLAEPARRGVVVSARDTGPGIADVEQALQDGYSTKGGLGCGLSGARRLVDEFEITSEAGGGTTVVLRKFVTVER